MASAGLSAQRFRSGHDAYLHDIALDFYGKRLATCSVDRSIRIWERSSSSPSSHDGAGGWKLAATLPDAHHAPILKLSWAHPEFGQGVLASCSSDCFVHVYEEIPVAGSQQKKWVRRAAHADAKDEVTDVQFAPPHLGLKLASCSKDGVVRVYEAYDIVNLTMWQLQQEFLVPDAGECTSISWSTSMFDPSPMLLVGTKRNGASVWQYAAEARTYKCIGVLPVNVKPRASLGGTNSLTILDVDWAPSIGRPYHLLATGSADGFVRIYKLTFEDGRCDCKLAAELTDNQSEIWRVSWNVTGTILASSGDDGRVLLWKSSFAGEWSMAMNASSISAQASAASTPAPAPKDIPSTSLPPSSGRTTEFQSLKTSQSDTNLALKHAAFLDAKTDY